MVFMTKCKLFCAHALNLAAAFGKWLLWSDRKATPTALYHVACNFLRQTQALLAAWAADNLGLLEWAAHCRVLFFFNGVNKVA